MNEPEPKFNAPFHSCLLRLKERSDVFPAVQARVTFPANERVTATAGATEPCLSNALRATLSQTLLSSFVSKRYAVANSSHQASRMLMSPNFMGTFYQFGPAEAREKVRSMT